MAGVELSSFLSIWLQLLDQLQHGLGGEHDLDQPILSAAQLRHVAAQLRAVGT